MRDAAGRHAIAPREKSSLISIAQQTANIEPTARPALPHTGQFDFRARDVETAKIICAIDEIIIVYGDHRPGAIERRLNQRDIAPL